jgi:hypothetical protein
VGLKGTHSIAITHLQEYKERCLGCSRRWVLQEPGWHARRERASEDTVMLPLPPTSNERAAGGGDAAFNERALLLVPAGQQRDLRRRPTGAVRQPAGSSSRPRRAGTWWGRYAAYGLSFFSISTRLALALAFGGIAVACRAQVGAPRLRGFGQFFTSAKYCPH